MAGFEIISDEGFKFSYLLNFGQKSSQYLRRGYGGDIYSKAVDVLESGLYKLIVACCGALMEFRF